MRQQNKNNNHKLSEKGNNMKDAKVTVGFAMFDTSKHRTMEKYPKQHSTAWFYVFENKKGGQDLFKSVFGVLGEEFDSFVCEIRVSELFRSIRKMRKALPEAVFEKVFGSEQLKDQKTAAENRYKIRIGINIANIFSTPGLDDDMARIRRAIEENDVSLLFDVQREDGA